MMVATLLEDDFDGLRRAMRDLDGDADAYEVRFDALRTAVDPAEVRRLTSKPLIATCRRPEDGGKFAGGEPARLKLLESAHKAGFEYVDVEDAAPVHVPAEHAIHSRHDLKTTPGVTELVRRAKELSRGRGGHVKHASPIDSFVDTLNILEAIPAAQAQSVNASLMGLGEFPRALAHLVGNEFTYGGGRRNAPGQPSLASIRATLRSWGDPAPAQNLLLVVGRPLAHSLSPRIHNAALRALGINGAYGALELRNEAELAMLLRRGPTFGLHGLSVTAPLKEDAWTRVDRSTPEAQAAKSVNCIKLDRGYTLGHNTDGVGAQRVLERLLKVGRSDRVMVIGTGGAARGIISGVKGPRFAVAGRSAMDLRRFADDFKVETIPLDVAPIRYPEFSVLINATSVEDPMSLEGFRGALFDVHYGGQATAWERHAKAKKLAFAGGRELLLEQALPAFEFWTGQAAPRDVMMTALGGGGKKT